MKISPYLLFQGQCEEAFRMYEKVLGGKIQMILPYEGSPMAQHAPADWGKKVMHASLDAGGFWLYGTDVIPSQFKTPQGMSITLDIEKASEAERVFAALAEGGRVKMALQETFWAERYGDVTDRFGIPWMVNCAKPMPAK